MYKNLFLSIVFIIPLTQTIFANNLPVKNQDVSSEQLKSQNIEIAKLAVEQLSKDLPQEINKYTTITNIKAIGASIIYTYEINTGAKSDDAIKAEDRSQWEKVYVENVCNRSKRFIDAQIDLSYVYNSAKTKAKLFQFDITQEKCFNRQRR